MKNSPRNAHQFFFTSHPKFEFLGAPFSVFIACFLFFSQAFAGGIHVRVNQQWLVKGGVGYDQTPSNDTDRNVQLPDGNRFILSLGVHWR